MPGQAGPTTPPWQRHQALTPRRFGLIPFRSPLLRDSRYCFLFLGLLRCFNSPGSLLRPYVFRPGYQRITAGGFPHSDILGSMVVWRLPEAFRSLPRPSSAPSAKASTVRPYQLGIDARARYGVSKVPEERLGHCSRAKKTAGSSAAGGLAWTAYPSSCLCLALESVQRSPSFVS